MNQILNATYEGFITINNKKLDVAILENGMKLINHVSVYKVFGKTRRGRLSKENEKKKILSFVNIDLFSDLLDEELIKKLTSTSYKTLKNQNTEGYPAEILKDLSKIYTKRKRDSKLPPSQEVIAIEGEKILNDLFKVDIHQLIYYNLNYSFEKEYKKLLNVLLPFFESDIYEWIKVIPILFYIELFRNNGWDFTVLEIEKRPSIIATWIKTLVFDQLPQSISTELKEKDPKIENLNNYNFKNWLITESIGNSHLKGQLNQIITLFQISENMYDTWNHINTLKLHQRVKVKSPFLFNEKGETIEPIEESFLSDFNKKLRIALNFNPKNN
ncbi:P63C domain-containing protein [Tenacibaculum sp. IB213877]|uniref:P63C domain-containing protein n=1 Tax=Tenacibaculum sp. IB213877 TaxID=3097351 RepID=UPI002A5A7DAF|nr:P63C domain-containing protein [Tenacibaculum sp. IB213877]MDY0780805.1 P63C domain-containing protein [Tenacibaculum sp. IB213877]